MGSKKGLSEEETALFRGAVKNVKPLQSPRQATPPPRFKRRPVTPEKFPALTGAESWLTNLAPGDWLDSEDPLHFAKPGIQYKTIQRLKRGQVECEATIDLHRQTLNQAMTQMTLFIEDCVEAGKRCVCVIHGKGRYSSSQKPLLKNFLNQWLREQPFVLAFYSATPKHGGTGALYLLLKRAELS